MNKPSVIYLKNKFITVVVNNKPVTCNSSEPIFNNVVEAYKLQDWDLLTDLLSRPKMIERYSENNIKVYDGVVTFKGKPVHNYVVDKIFSFMEEGFDFMPLVRFLDSLMANSNPDIQNDLFYFLEANEMAITDDGGFLAYKLTHSDGAPYYQSGSSIRYKVGETVEMPKEEVVCSKDECGGAGLYFGNKGYWNNNFDDQGRYTGDGKMFIVKLMPEWVVSIPSREAKTKGRAYKMEVVAEYETVRETVNNNSIVEIKDPDMENTTKVVKPKRDKFGRFAKKSAPVRDSKGRFVSK